MAGEPSRRIHLVGWDPGPIRPRLMHPHPPIQIRHRDGTRGEPWGAVPKKRRTGLYGGRGQPEGVVNAVQIASSQRAFWLAFLPAPLDASSVC